MNQWLRISIGVNFLLGLVILCLVAGPQQLPIGSLAVQISDAVRPVQDPHSVPAVANVEAFRWNQLESTNYRTYVANLRSVGCPEQTVRDIVTADLDGAYAPRRAQLESNLRVGVASHKEVEAALGQLRQDETYAITNLLGPGPDLAPQVSPKTPAWVVAKRNFASVMPLAFRDFNSAALGLDEQQLDVVGRVRQNFERELGPQDTNDPTYRERWNVAQRNADDTLRGLLGSKAYVQFQIQPANEVGRQ